MSDDEAPEWKADDASHARTAAALAAIDARQANAPTCWLCDQRANRLDKHGLCSKTSRIHQEARGGIFP